MFDSSFQLLLRRLGLVFLLYTLLRAVFFIFNFNHFAEASAGQVALAFVHGLRFDVAALVAINSLFILLSLLPHGNLQHPKYQRTLQWLFVLTNAPFIALALVDVEFFKFIGRRSGNEVLTITGDVLGQLGQLASYYWYMGIGFLGLMISIAKLYPKSVAIPEKTPVLWQRYLRLVLVAGFVVLGIRGGIQLKPLRPAHAFVHEHATLGHLSLNTPFTFIKSIGKTSLDEKHFFASDEELLANLPVKPDQYAIPAGEALQENVVLIILESFASEYVGALNKGEGYTPFLDSLANEGVLFQNSFANGRKSIEALPSILSGLPSLLPDPYITSPYQSNTVYSAGHLLRGAGYTTAFFHGATNGTMGFNQYTQMAGIQHYFGLDEYPSELRAQHFDGNWGIFDEPYLQYTVQEMSKFRQPFFSTIFTLSSHQPYTVPAQYKGKFPKGELEIHESIGYADYALREFFKTASRQPWYENTLFILVADHTQKSIRPEYQNELGHYRVPLLLFHPAKKLKADAQKVTQHADILPTMMDYLKLPTNKLTVFGQSVLDSTATGHALLYNGVSYYMVQQHGVAELTPADELRFHSFPEMTPAAPENKNQGVQLKAYVQYFKNKMVSNDLYFWQRRN
ncbi:LTA synthase family protein [Pontibacter ramchanderi]|uniref:Phosphoglycerol transferase MdoB-like AlkP superfamily enzyme n=1 Tax=Pontibacter ramchanderi TaxID=1179743 RepID=A0A2N3V2F1_9BACT|nr:alkaline phosphatase family protein [Pontibacter ramchanderi]PKV75809.1 phosphoglycerol transferase MdoB-like AlkP superfamily enzyme [Pontibacter ramchanderi]